MPDPDPVSTTAPTISAADAEALGQAKRVLRRAVRQRRGARPDADRTRDDKARFAVLRQRLAEHGGLGCAACYVSGPPEPDTLRLISWLSAAGVDLLLPSLTAADDGSVPDPDWAPYAGPGRLAEGPFGIIQPSTRPLGPEALGEAELIILPGLAATRTGERLGRGGGWYDRALEHASSGSTSVVLLNDDELLEVVPTQPWDRRVDAVATPSRWLDCATDTAP